MATAAPGAGMAYAAPSHSAAAAHPHGLAPPTPTPWPVNKQLQPTLRSGSRRNSLSLQVLHEEDRAELEDCFEALAGDSVQGHITVKHVARALASVLGAELASDKAARVAFDSMGANISGQLDKQGFKSFMVQHWVPTHKLTADGSQPSSNRSSVDMNPGARLVEIIRSYRRKTLGERTLKKAQVQVRMLQQAHLEGAGGSSGGSHLGSPRSPAAARHSIDVPSLPSLNGQGKTAARRRSLIGAMPASVHETPVPEAGEGQLGRNFSQSTTCRRRSIGDFGPGGLNVEVPRSQSCTAGWQASPGSDASPTPLSRFRRASMLLIEQALAAERQASCQSQDASLCSTPMAGSPSVVSPGSTPSPYTCASPGAPSGAQAGFAARADPRAEDSAADRSAQQAEAWEKGLLDKCGGSPLAPDMMLRHQESSMTASSKNSFPQAPELAGLDAELSFKAQKTSQNVTEAMFKPMPPAAPPAVSLSGVSFGARSWLRAPEFGLDSPKHSAGQLMNLLDSQATDISGSALFASADCGSLFVTAQEPPLPHDQAGARTEAWPPALEAGPNSARDDGDPSTCGASSVTSSDSQRPSVPGLHAEAGDDRKPFSSWIGRRLTRFLFRESHDDASSTCSGDMASRPGTAGTIGQIESFGAGGAPHWPPQGMQGGMPGQWPPQGPGMMHPMPPGYGPGAMHRPNGFVVPGTMPGVVNANKAMLIGLTKSDKSIKDLHWHLKHKQEIKRDRWHT